MDLYEKKYKEALERARGNYNVALNYNKEEEIQELEYIFPELKESEDERIRKWLIPVVDRLLGTIDCPFGCDKVLAWLEKQGECHISHDDEIMIEQLTEYFTTGHGLQNTNETVVAWLNDVKRKLEKQGEQKPTDKVEPKFKVGDIVKHKDNPHLTYILKRITNDGDYEFHAIGKDGNEGCTRFAAIKCQDEWDAEKKGLKKIEQKWSEEDETTLNNLIYALANDRIGCCRDEYVDWLKSIKDRVQPQPKQEWSEEDEVKINRIVACLENLNVADNDILLKDVEWLKSLRPQSTWKPSDEQIEVLDEAIDIVTKTEKFSIATALKVLLEQLKSL